MHQIKIYIPIVVDHMCLLVLENPSVKEHATLHFNLNVKEIAFWLINDKAAKDVRFSSKILWADHNANLPIVDKMKKYGPVKTYACLEGVKLKLVLVNSTATSRASYAKQSLVHQHNLTKRIWNINVLRPSNSASPLFERSNQTLANAT